jgi:hypothetical protein
MEGGKRRHANRKKRGNGEREEQLDAHVDKHGDAPALNTKCCKPTITGDTKVFLYVHYVDDDAF